MSNAKKTKLWLGVLLALGCATSAGCARSAAKRARRTELPFYTPEIQLLKTHIRAAVDVIDSIPNCKLLVWGAGYDSKLWCKVNEKGTTYIIEDDREWADRIAPQIPCRVIMTHYQTKLSQAGQLIYTPQALQLELPPDIRRTKFDVIIVDAPDGSYPGAPGRMKSIFMSSVLSYERSHIFVDDYQRPVEKNYSARFLQPIFGAPQVLPGRNLFAHFAKDRGGM